MPTLDTLPAWQELKKHYTEIKNIQMKDLFELDSERFEKLSMSINDIIFDYSKNRVNRQTIQSLLSLA